MKPAVILLLLFMLAGCQLKPAAYSAREVANKVKDCCTSMSIAKSITLPSGNCCPEKNTRSVLSSALLERSGLELTW